MKILILNGNPKDDTKFDEYIDQLSSALKLSNHIVTIQTLKDMDIRYCIGCFGCWVKTPGECSIAADDTRDIRKAYMNSDLVIFVSPIIMGRVG